MHWSLILKQCFRFFVVILHGSHIRAHTILTLIMRRLPISEIKALSKLGIPVLFTQLGIMVVNFADTIMVGAYGTPELAAAAFVNNLFLSVVVLLIGFAAGLTPLLGALFSRKENFETGQICKLGLIINALLSLTLTIIMAGLYFFLDSMGQPTHLLPLIRQYYLITLLTLLPAGVFNACQQMANSITDTSLPMWIILIANAFNILGNYLLIYGHFGMPEMGLAGAGWSSVAARWGACIAILLYVIYGRRYRPYTEGLRKGKYSSPSAHKIIATSVPVMVQAGAGAAAWSLGSVVSGWFGETQLAAYQVVNVMSQIGFLTYISLGTAITIRVANKMGTTDYHGIRLTTYSGLGLNLVFAIAASLLFLLDGRHMFHIFTPDAVVIDMALTLVIPLVIYQIFDAMQVTLGYALRGTGFVQPLLWIALMAYGAVGVPMMLWLANGLNMGARGVYYSYTIMLTVACVSYWWCFERRLRKLTIGKKLATFG